MDIFGSDEGFRELAVFITGLMITLAADELTFRPFKPGDYMTLEDFRERPVAKPAARF